MAKIIRNYTYECPLCFVGWDGYDSEFKNCKICQRKICIDCGCINENCKLYSELYKVKERKK